MTYHRGFRTHSSFKLCCSRARVAGGPPKIGIRPIFLRWCLAIYLCFVTHTLADFFTVYGTQVLWPFTDYPFAHSLLFIIDPIYTLPLLVGFWGFIS